MYTLGVSYENLHVFFLFGDGSPVCTIMLVHKVPLDTFDSPFEGCSLSKDAKRKG